MNVAPVAHVERTSFTVPSNPLCYLLLTLQILFTSRETVCWLLCAKEAQCAS
jgi:hypothetical protein